MEQRHNVISFFYGPEVLNILSYITCVQFVMVEEVRYFTKVKVPIQVKVMYLKYHR